MSDRLKYREGKLKRTGEELKEPESVTLKAEEEH